MDPETSKSAQFLHGGSPLPEVEYGLRVVGRAAHPWRVLRMQCRERLSEPYEATLELAAPSASAMGESLHAEVLELTMSRGGEVLRRLYGTVRRVDDLGIDASSRVLRVWLVPRLWGLSLRSDSRIFQEMTAQEIVRAVLSKAKLYQSDTLRDETRIYYRKREYCVQHRETDFVFVSRLLEDEGIPYYFEHAEGAAHETLVLVDDYTRFTPLPTLQGGVLGVVNQAVSTASVETVRRLDASHRLTTNAVTLRDFDPESPGTLHGVMTQRVPSDGHGGFFEHPGEYALRDRGGASRDYSARLAGMRWQEYLTRRDGADGESNATVLTPGYTFTLTDHARDDLNTSLLVVGVDHRGAAPEVVSRNAAAGSEDRYANRFIVVRATGPWVPPRITPRPRIESVQTAIVTGPAGEEIYTDAQARIKVRFHWDRGDSPDDQSTCWIRVAQSWAGAGWGTQFIPRVGMEVLVTFLDGNPDRPVVTGCLYNGATPPTFAVPSDKTRSGWRTQSSLGGAGFNEFSFEDLAGSEQVYLHAQRDHDEVVERNHTGRIGVDDLEHVGHDQWLKVDNDRTEIVGGSRRELVTLDQVERIGGNCEETIEQDHTVRVTGAQYMVSLDAHRTVNRNATRVVGGNDRREVTGTSNDHVKDDAVTRVDGNSVTVVGKYDAQRTYLVHAEGRAVVQSSTLTEITSEKELILRVGATRIRITEEGIELTAKTGLTLRSGNTVVEVTPDKARIRSKGKAVISADSVNILTDSAQVKLADEVKITGSMVKLNPPKTDTETDDEPKPPKPTKLEFKDQDGRPLANQRFVIRLADGAEIAGVLDHEGKAEVEIEGGGEAKVTFPDVGEVKPA